MKPITYIAPSPTPIPFAGATEEWCWKQFWRYAGPALYRLHCEQAASQDDDSDAAAGGVKRPGQAGQGGACGG